MTGRTAKSANLSRAAGRRDAPFRLADHLRSDKEVAAYVQAILEDGDARVLTVGLRNATDAIGGMAALATKTGLSRETLYRTLSASGNPRLDTLAAILAAFGLRLSVQPDKRAAQAAFLKVRAGSGA